MKTIQELFPNASKSTVDANPHLMATLSHPDNKNALQVNRGGKKRGSMNKTEAEFALMLEAQKRKGEILNYRFEAVKVRVGNGCFYVPDFFIEHEDKKPLFVEIKGFMRDDARVKFLASKELHTWANWEMWKKAKSGWSRIL